MPIWACALIYHWPKICGPRATGREVGRRAAGREVDRRAAGREVDRGPWAVGRRAAGLRLAKPHKETGSDKQFVQHCSTNAVWQWRFVPHHSTAFRNSSHHPTGCPASLFKLSYSTRWRNTSQFNCELWARKYLLSLADVRWRWNHQPDRIWHTRELDYSRS